MPIYEYYCPTCATKFEKLRSIAVADQPAICSAGHTTARKLISVFAVGNRAGEESAMSEFSMPMGGGCACGGGGCTCGG